MKEAQRGFIRALKIMEVDLPPKIMATIMIGPLNEIEDRIKKMLKDYKEKMIRESKHKI